MSRDEPAENENAVVDRLPTGCRRWLLGGAGWVLAAILLFGAGLWFTRTRPGRVLCSATVVTAG